MGKKMGGGEEAEREGIWQKGDAEPVKMYGEKVKRMTRIIWNRSPGGKVKPKMFQRES